ncbi:MAG TPA: hypothetical protein VNZ45_14660, partial [Bacteroidia bacterium]|nr:hypothetical protein [Bacteroidia bacterium]
MSQILNKITGKIVAYRLLISVCSVLLFSLHLAAQNNTPPPTSTWTIEVKGMVTENDKKLPGSVITVYEGANAVSTVNSSDGKFDLTLEQDKDYTITFTKPGYITKRISFSTKNVTGERGKFGFTAFTIDEVDIFPEMEGTDIDKILQQPVAKIEYDAKYHNGDFNFDERYTESIQSILEKILAAKRALELQYKNVIKRADVEFSKQQYPLAKGDYLAALKLKPNEQYPKDQLAAIEKALADQKAKDDENAKKLAAQGALQAKYDSAIRIADAAFAAKDYKNAKSAYTSASEVFADKRYPKDQLRAIERALSGESDNAQKAAQQAKYDSLVKIADADFSSKKYDEAKDLYNEAIKVLPKNRYPRDQLALIDKTKSSEQGNAKAAAEEAKYDSLVKIGDAA